MSDQFTSKRSDMTPPENEITHSAIATFVSIIKSMAYKDHNWDYTPAFSD